MKLTYKNVPFEITGNEEDGYSYSIDTRLPDGGLLKCSDHDFSGEFEAQMSAEQMIDDMLNSMPIKED